MKLKNHTFIETVTGDYYPVAHRKLIASGRKPPNSNRFTISFSVLHLHAHLACANCGLGIDHLFNNYVRFPPRLKRRPGKALGEKNSDSRQASHTSVFQKNLYLTWD